MIFENGIFGKIGVGYTRFFQFFQFDFVIVQPIAVGLLVDQLIFYFVIGEDTALLHVDKENLACLLTAFFDDGRLLDRKCPCFRSNNDAVV
ncbi:hypothetical protein D3C81_810720 [compost metagenome]